MSDTYTVADARERIRMARLGWITTNMTHDYLDEIELQLLDWLESVERERRKLWTLERRVAARENT